jgi:hypothetical protein
MIHSGIVMVVDASILEKLRLASQQYNKKKPLASRVDTWHCLSQSDSQTFPSTQACTSIHSTQQTRTRFPHSQLDLPINDVKLSQATSSTKYSIPGSTLSFDAYCQTETIKCATERSVTTATSPIKPPRLVIDSAKTRTILSPSPTNDEQTQTIADAPSLTDPQLMKYITTLTEGMSAGFRDVLAAVNRADTYTKAKNSDTEEDELVYLSFLFEHDHGVLKLFDAPVSVRETSCKPATVCKQVPRKRNRKVDTITLNPVKEDDDVAPPTIQSSFTSGLKRARFTA